MYIGGANINILNSFHNTSRGLLSHLCSKSVVGSFPCCRVNKSVSHPGQGQPSAAKTGENECSASYIASLLAPTFPAHLSATHLLVLPLHDKPLERQIAQKRKKRKKKQFQAINVFHVWIKPCSVPRRGRECITHSLFLAA